MHAALARSINLDVRREATDLDVRAACSWQLGTDMLASALAAGGEELH